MMNWCWCFGVRFSFQTENDTIPKVSNNTKDTQWVKTIIIVNTEISTMTGKAHQWGPHDLLREFSWHPMWNSCPPFLIGHKWNWMHHCNGLIQMGADKNGRERKLVDSKPHQWTPWAFSDRFGNKKLRLHLFLNRNWVGGHKSVRYSHMERRIHDWIDHDR